MAKPRIFISSTYYDFKNVRDDLDRFIRNMGYESVRHEVGQVPYERNQKLDTSCYKEIEYCDILICLIGGRFGSTSNDGQYSITQKELKTALDVGKQVYIFIDAPIHYEYDFYLDNKDKPETKYRHATNIKVHQFIEEIRALDSGNIIFQFNTTSEIISILQEQWAGLFQRLLLESASKINISLAQELRQSIQTANQLTEYLSKQKDSESTTIEHILISNHPIFSALRKKLNIKHRIYFETLNELSEWLKSRSITKVARDSWDSESHIEWIMDGRTENEFQLLKVSASLFDQNEKLIPMSHNEWDEEMVIYETRNKGVESDEIPF